MKIKRILGSIIIALAVFSQTAQAKTPDGIVPANEAVCDGLVGSTPGLYGLCVAFCEAQDAEATLDTVTGEITFPPGARPSNPKLLERYNSKSALGDPPMPCLNVVEPPTLSCIAWTAEELASLALGSATYMAGSLGASISGVDLMGQGEIAYTEMVAGGYIAGINLWTDTGQTVVHISVTEQQYLDCTETIRIEAENRGLPNRPPR